MTYCHMITNQIHRYKDITLASALYARNIHIVQSLFGKQSFSLASLNATSLKASSRFVVKLL